MIVFIAEQRGARSGCARSSGHFLSTTVCTSALCTVFFTVCIANGKNTVAFFALSYIPFATFQTVALGHGLPYTVCDSFFYILVYSSIQKKILEAYNFDTHSSAAATKFYKNVFTKSAATYDSQ